MIMKTCNKIVFMLWQTIRAKRGTAIYPPPFWQRLRTDGNDSDRKHSRVIIAVAVAAAVAVAVAVDVDVVAAQNNCRPLLSLGDPHGLSDATSLSQDGRHDVFLIHCIYPFPPAHSNKHTHTHITSQLLACIVHCVVKLHREGNSRRN